MKSAVFLELRTPDHPKSPLFRPPNSQATLLARILNCATIEVTSDIERTWSVTTGMPNIRNKSKKINQK